MSWKYTFAANERHFTGTGIGVLISASTVPDVRAVVRPYFLTRRPADGAATFTGVSYPSASAPCQDDSRFTSATWAIATSERIGLTKLGSPLRNSTMSA